MTANRKLYRSDEKGGFEFSSDRRSGEVRIPNYVYDLWMPLLGIEVIGVYAVYCRLEREGAVKGITQADLARCLKIGARRLNDINGILAQHGFITVEKPQGYDRYKHYTTKITVKDPPSHVTADQINAHDEGRKTTKYQPLTLWLVAGSEMSNDFSPEVNEHLDEMSNDNAKIASLGLHPVEDCTAPPKSESLPPLSGSSKEVDAAIFDGKSPEPPTPSSARPPSPLPPNYARMEADLGVKHPLITAYETAFDENPPINTERNVKNRQLAHTLAKQGYTPEQVTACVRSKVRAGKLDYPFAWLAGDLPAFIRRQKPVKAPTTSPAPVEHVTPMTAEEWAAAVNSPEFKALKLKVAQ